MPRMNYRIWHWGEDASQGVCQIYDVALTTKAKSGMGIGRFVVANEIVCQRLGKILGLPVPEGTIIQDDEDNAFYASLNFNVNGLNLPPANAEQVAQEQPHLACGTIVFDIWMANGDRHENNLHYDSTRKQLYIFDHSHALFGTEGPLRLNTLGNDLGIPSHCLALEAVSLQDAAFWVGRAKQIPIYCIREALVEATYGGLPPEAIDDALESIVKRREIIFDLIEQNISMFPKLEPNLFGLGQEGNNKILDDYCI